MSTITVDEYNITVTEPAQQYLAELLAKQEDVIGVRLYVDKPGTPKAETLLTYCRENNHEGTVLREFKYLNVYLDEQSIKFLHEATVNYDQEEYGGSLTIRAPNSKLPRLGEDATLEEKVNYVLWNDVNPGIAAHGGECNLVEITEDKVAILSFGGGCQGCAQVDVTLKYGVEKQLMDELPELTGVKDVTDHSDTSNAFY
jgi:Fe/S biogenesis protein NfuA|tara:strand:+ start:451 stop:1050 length:600 start_codon:yes stop_codon:yes gene_type:complete